MNESALGGSVVWVSGGAQGIGKSIAGDLLRSGHRIWITDIDAERAREAADDLGVRDAASERISAFGCDVTRESDVIDAAARIAEESGRLDVLINAAGLIQVDDILEMPYDTWKRVMTVNVDGTVLTNRAAAGRMRAQPVDEATGRRGLIVNIGSAAAEGPRPRLSAYGASKAAVKHWSASLAEALRPDAVAVAVLYPGMVVDGMYRTILEREAAMDGRSYDELSAERAASVPSGRYQRPDELGAFVEHLLVTPGMAASGRVVWTAPHLA